MAKGSKTKALKFESPNPNDSYFSIHRSLYISPAFKSLTKGQRYLYCMMKAQHFSSNKPDKSDPLKFCFSWGMAQEIAGYTNENQFKNDKDALIEKGFITCEDGGKFTRTKAVYRFSDMWQKYGTTAFKLDRSKMSVSLNNRLNRENNQDK